MSDSFDIVMEDSLPEDDLDSLLLDDVPVEDSPQVESFVPSMPHWRFDRKELASLLRVVSAFPTHTHVFFIVRREGDSVLVHVNNRDAVLNYRLPLLNASDAPYPKRDYFLDFRVLSQLVAVYPDFVLGFDDSDVIYFLAKSVEYKLEVLPLTFDRMGILDGVDDPSLSWSAYPLTKSQTNTLKTLFSFAVSITDNKVYFGDGFVDSFYSMYQHQFRGTPSISTPTYLRKADIPIILEVVCPETTMAVGDKRVYIKFPQGSVSFLRLVGEYTPVDMSANEESVGGAKVSVPAFKRAIKVTQILSIPQVEFTMGDGKDIVMHVGRNAHFIIGTGRLLQSVPLSIGLLARLFSTLDPTVETLDLDFRSEHLTLFVGGDVPSKYVLTRTSIAGFNREVKIQEKIDNREQRMESRTAKGRMSENLADANESLDEILQDL